MHWAAAQVQPQRDGLALHCLRQAGFETYAPRLREPRTVQGRKVIRTPLLFPGYLFVLIELQWHRAQRTSPAQAEMLDRLTGAGVIVGIARGIDDALTVLQGWQLLRGAVQ
jgi:Transcription termination factor nusG